MSFTLPNLPYSFDALEPHIDAKTMEIHHGKHHAAYIAKLNAAVKGTKWENDSIEEILKHIGDVDESIRGAVMNHGGGHINHTLFWTLLSPKPQTVSGQIAAKINESFSSFEEFKAQFAQAAATRFGSGWAWLVVKEGALVITSTANQDSPYMHGATPILGLDVWEHAYYLHYQNRRPDYINAFFNVVNWERVNELYLATT